MTVCVPEPILYLLVVAAAARGLARNGGLRSLLTGSDGRDAEKDNDDG